MTIYDPATKRLLPESVERIYAVIDHCSMSDTAKAALRECIATKGPRQGRLKSKAPSSYDAPEAHAAWHGAMLAVNPYKAGVGSLMLMSPEQRAIAIEVTDALDALGALKIAFDKDRLELERLGVW